MRIPRFVPPGAAAALIFAAVVFEVAVGGEGGVAEAE
jgi:hypothetical protein